MSPSSPCIGCAAPLGITSTDLHPLVCSDCREFFCEWLASKLDPAYDKTAMNAFPECVAKFWGMELKSPWHWWMDGWEKME